MSTIRATNFQHASAAAPAIVLAADGTATATVSGINGGPLAGLKNKIINGAMDVSQRGTTFTAIGTGYTLDRFRWVSSGAMVVNVNQSTVVPNNTFEYSLHVDVTTADTSIGSSDFAYIEHGIEGFNSRDLIGSTFTVSFWVRSPKTGTHCVSIRGAGGINYYVATYSISSANTWEYKSFTVTGGLPNDGSWDKKSNLGMSVSFVLAMGSLYHTATPNSWQSGNLFSTSAQVNCVDSATNDFYITGIQVEAGPVATPFERRPAGTELTLCERYYEIGNYLSNYYFNNSWAPATKNEHVTFRTTKRAVPVIGGTFTGGGWTGTWSTGGATNNGFWFGNNATTNAGTFGHSATWTASAEL